MGTESVMGIGLWRQHLAGLLSGSYDQPSFQEKVLRMSSVAQARSVSECSWEELWAPYDERNYQVVLSAVASKDVVLEIGAGDLRLARRIAEITHRVYAIEIQPAVLEKAGPTAKLPQNLEVIQGDARMIPFPPDITAAVLLMRHCSHFDLYVQKLLAAGCSRLITNARWGNGVEVIDLYPPRRSFDEIDIGWYACLCGKTGFKTGPPELLRPETIFNTAEVQDCPSCKAACCSIADLGHIIWKEDKNLETLPIFTNLPTKIKTLYQEGA
jgi:SAM-dependent methyltransferase